MTRQSFERMMVAGGVLPVIAVLVHIFTTGLQGERAHADMASPVSTGLHMGCAGQPDLFVRPVKFSIPP